MLNNKFLQGVLFSALLFPFQAFALSSTGEITGFHMKSCGPKKCVSVISQKVQEGLLAGNYFSNKAQVLIQHKKSPHKTIEINTLSFYYDSRHNFIYIKDVVGDNAQYSYELSTETLQRYPLANRYQ